MLLSMSFTSAFPTLYYNICVYIYIHPHIHTVGIENNHPVTREFGATS